MKLMMTAVAAAGALAAAGVIGTATATADAGDAATIHQIGTQGTVVSGGVVQGWTISDLKPSSDVIPYQSQGTLWEAAATDEAVQGSVVPVIANLSARSASGQTYGALFSVPTDHGVSPSFLAQGQKTSGKLYFDVVGDTPNSVVYQDDGQDLATWVSSAPQAQGSAGSGTRAPAQAASPARPARPTPAGGQTAPAGSSPGSSQNTPVAGGSQGTPLTEGSQGTPLAEAPGPQPRPGA